MELSPNQGSNDVMSGNYPFTELYIISFMAYLSKSFENTRNGKTMSYFQMIWLLEIGGLEFGLNTAHKVNTTTTTTSNH